MTKARAEAIKEFAAYLAEHLRQGIGTDSGEVRALELDTADWIEELAEEWAST